MNTEGKAKETANSRDGLDDYIRVSSPGVTAVIIALTVLVAAVIAWGLIGRLPVTETVTGKRRKAARNICSCFAFWTPRGSTWTPCRR